MRFYYILITISLFLFMLSGCAVGHDDYVNYKNRTVGTKKIEKKPFKWKDSGELIRSNFLVSGEGLTHISKDKSGNLIYHYSVQEVLPHFSKTEWVGKCLIYDVVDPMDYIITSWGFDEGGNPLSCRTWP